RDCAGGGKKNAPAALQDTEAALIDPAKGAGEMPASIRTELEEPIPAQPDEHMAILQTLLKLAASDTTDRLGPRGQQPRRALEQRVRSRAVQVAKRLTERGYSYADLARRLAVSERTLRSWNGCSAAANLAPPLGRPLA